MREEKEREAGSNAEAPSASTSKGASASTRGDRVGDGRELNEDLDRRLTGLAITLARRVPLWLRYMREDIVQEVLLYC